MLFVLMSWNEMRIEEVGLGIWSLRFLKLFLCFNWLFDIIVCIKKKKIDCFFLEVIVFNVRIRVRFDMYRFFNDKIFKLEFFVKKRFWGC